MRRANAAAVAATFVLGSLGAGCTSGLPSTRTHDESAASSPACPRGWASVPLARTERHADLVDVVAIGPDDAWAVGSRPGPEASSPQTLAEHWDGSRWMEVPTPTTIEPYGAWYVAVLANGPRDVWAVGEEQSEASSYALVDHWDGLQWRRVRAPHPRRWSGLADAALGPSGDLWLLGNGDPAFVLHRRGGRWSRLPNAPYRMESIAVDGRARPWVGATHQDPESGRYVPVAFRWTGGRWADMAPPAAGEGNHLVTELVAGAANDIWVVGAFDTTARRPSPTRSLLERWDGRRWVATRAPGFEDAVISDVVALDAARAWAVGMRAVKGDARSLIERWDGKSWHVAQAAAERATLVALDLLPDGAGWAIGGSAEGSIVLRHCP